jgi:hypothetical protein
MLPLFEGQVIGDFVNTVARQENPYRYLMEQASTDVPPIRIKEHAGVIIKNVDNQRKTHYTGPVDHSQVDLRYIPKELKEAYKFDQNVVNGLKRAPKLAKLLPKGKKPKEMREEFLNILKAEYKIE